MWAAVAAVFRRAPDGHLGGAKIYFKREELNHTGSHKVNNVLGQIMLARRMGKKRIIAETGAGSTASPPRRCARASAGMHRLHGRGRRARQAPNVFRMEMLAPGCAGAVRTRTLKTP